MNKGRFRINEISITADRGFVIGDVGLLNELEFPHSF